MRASSRGAMLRLLIIGPALAACGERATPGAEDDGQAVPAPALVEVGDGAGLALDSAVRARMGIRTEPAARASGGAEREVSGVVIADPGALTVLRAGVSGRLAAAGSRAWPRVGEVVEGGTELAQVGDGVPIAVPRSGTVVGLRAQPGELVQAGQPLLELVDYRTALVRVGWNEPATPPASLGFAPLAGGQRVLGTLEGAAAEADPLTRAPAYLYRLPGEARFRPGVAVLGFVAARGARHAGVRLPADAVVQWDALAWVYLEREPGRFTRVRVSTESPVPGGWLVFEGVAPGDRVVTRGAGQLLSEEFRARISVGEEVGE